MRLSKELRFGNRAKKYIPYLLENLREGHIVPLCYLVYSGTGRNLYEFYPSSMLKLDHVPIAYGYKDALLLVSLMTMEKLRGEGICPLH